MAGCATINLFVSRAVLETQALDHGSCRLPLVSGFETRKYRAKLQCFCSDCVNHIRPTLKHMRNVFYAVGLYETELHCRTVAEVVTRFRHEIIPWIFLSSQELLQRFHPGIMSSHSNPFSIFSSFICYLFHNPGSVHLAGRFNTSSDGKLYCKLAYSTEHGSCPVFQCVPVVLKQTFSACSIQAKNSHNNVFGAL